MTKQGEIVFFIENKWEKTAYIVVDIDDDDICLLLKITSSGNNQLHRILVKKSNIKNNCFDDVESFGGNEAFGDLEGDLLRINSQKIDKWIEKRKKETGCDY